MEEVIDAAPAQPRGDNLIHPNKDYWTRNVNSEIVEVNFNNFMVSWRTLEIFSKFWIEISFIKILKCFRCLKTMSIAGLGGVVRKSRFRAEVVWVMSSASELGMATCTEWKKKNGDIQQEKVDRDYSDFLIQQEKVDRDYSDFLIQQEKVDRDYSDFLIDESTHHHLLLHRQNQRQQLTDKCHHHHHHLLLHRNRHRQDQRQQHAQKKKKK
jgi:hypothetical protein